MNQGFTLFLLRVVRQVGAANIQGADRGEAPQGQARGGDLDQGVGLGAKNNA